MRGLVPFRPTDGPPRIKHRRAYIADASAAPRARMTFRTMTPCRDARRKLYRFRFPAAARGLGRGRLDSFPPLEEPCAGSTEGAVMSEQGSVVGLWRYPVKSMMGEELNAAELSERGVPGDSALCESRPASSTSTSARGA